MFLNIHLYINYDHYLNSLSLIYYEIPKNILALSYQLISILDPIFHI